MPYVDFPAIQALPPAAFKLYVYWLHRAEQTGTYTWSVSLAQLGQESGLQIPPAWRYLAVQQARRGWNGAARPGHVDYPRVPRKDRSTRSLSQYLPAGENARTDLPKRYGGKEVKDTPQSRFFCPGVRESGCPLTARIWVSIDTAHHSHTPPVMSHTSKSFCEQLWSGNSSTLSSDRRASVSLESKSSPYPYLYPRLPRHALSHSASVGNLFPTFSQYSLASYQLTPNTALSSG